MDINNQLESIPVGCVSVTFVVREVVYIWFHVHSERVGHIWSHVPSGRYTVPPLGYPTIPGIPYPHSPGKHMEPGTRKGPCTPPRTE